MLYIDSEKQILFIHIPKCAGTSIEKFFGFDYDNNIHFEHKIKTQGHSKHLTLKEYENILGFHIVNKLYKFTIIRNPFDMVLSSYNYSINSDNIFWNGKNDIVYKKSIPFNEYVKHTQYNYPDGFKYYMETINNKMDFIVRFENIKEDFKTICDRIGIVDKILPFENISNHNNINYRDYYDDKTKDIVYKLFKDDLSKYNYEF